MRASRAAALSIIAAAGWLPHAVAAQEAEPFRGKTITIVIGYAAGGTYDAIARMLARHMPAHIPGHPSITPQQMTGAGSIKAILHLYAVAPKDGTTLGVISRSYAVEPIFSPEVAKYDATRFNPIGSTSSEVATAAVWHTSPIRTFADLKSRELTVGATGITDDTGRYPVLARNLTGAKIKIVDGYPGGNDITYAMERGEVEGRFGWSWGSIKSRSKAWLDEKKITIIYQMALAKAPDLPDTPFIMDDAKTELDRNALELILAQQTTAWPLIAPPDVPAPRLAQLRQAYDDTMKDPAFRADADRLRIDIDPISGLEMLKLTQRINGFDRKVVERALQLTSAGR